VFGPEDQASTISKNVHIMSLSLDHKQKCLDHKPSNSKSENVWTMQNNAWSIIQTIFTSQNVSITCQHILWKDAIDKVMGDLPKFRL
jgi:hypothetical protein